MTALAACGDDGPSSAPDPEEATTQPASPPASPPAVPDVTPIEFARVEEPVALATRPGDDRLFVVERAGRVVLIDRAGGQRVVLDISDVVSSEYYENGLLGLAFHPDEPLAYIFFVGVDGNTHVVEYPVDLPSGELDGGNSREIMTIDQPALGHNGGQLAFGPDGRLYIGVGDGENPGDPDRKAQQVSSKLGKILRIDPSPAGDASYTVPPDNPFVGTPGADPTVWSRGLRNPWSFSFDTMTGDLWIADAGQNTLEEINHVSASQGPPGRGANFGWSAYEGDMRFNADQHVDDHLPPVATLDHASGACAVVGGQVARDSALEHLEAVYMFGDWCTGEIWALNTESPRAAPVGPLTTIPQLTAIHLGADGVVIVASLEGPVYRLAGS